MVGMIQGERERIMVRLGHALRGGKQRRRRREGLPHFCYFFGEETFFLSKLA